MYFDTHAHYDDERFEDDRSILLADMHKNGIDLIVNPGSDMSSSKRAVEIASGYDFVYAAIGVHPHEAESMTDSDFDTLEKMSKHPKVVAIGEIGLDYHYDLSPRDIQKLRFRQQLELARKLELPAVIHEREAAEDTLNIVKDFPDVRGVYHCYSGSWETAKTILAQGWYLSFTGAITFKGARRALEVIKNIPLDRIMIETDSPYLAPVPNRGKRNCSLNLPYIAAVIADLRGLSIEEVAILTKENGKKFFDIM